MQQMMLILQGSEIYPLEHFVIAQLPEKALVRLPVHLQNPGPPLAVQEEIHPQLAQARYSPLQTLCHELTQVVQLVQDLPGNHLPRRHNRAVTIGEQAPGRGDPAQFTADLPSPLPVFLQHDAHIELDAAPLQTLDVFLNQVDTYGNSLCKQGQV